MYLSGAIYAATGGYDAGFYFAGSIVFLSGIILFVLPWIKQAPKEDTTTKLCGQTTNPMIGAAFALHSALVWQKKTQRRNSVTLATKF